MVGRKKGSGGRPKGSKNVINQIKFMMREQQRASMDAAAVDYESKPVTVVEDFPFCPITAADLARIAKGSALTPLEFMSAMMNDPFMNPDYRARMASSAAQYIHREERKAEKKNEAAANESVADQIEKAETRTKKGKKEIADDLAATAGLGTEWGSDLLSRVVRN